MTCTCATGERCQEGLLLREMVKQADAAYDEDKSAKNYHRRIAAHHTSNSHIAKSLSNKLKQEGVP